MKINFVYLGDIIPTTISLLVKHWGFCHDDAIYEYLKNTEEGWTSKKASRKNWKKFLDSLVPGEMYFFITVPILDEHWLLVSERAGFKDKLVWSSRAQAHNTSYPEDPPKLKAYLYRW